MGRGTTGAAKPPAGLELDEEGFESDSGEALPAPTDLGMVRSRGARKAPSKVKLKQWTVEVDAAVIIGGRKTTIRAGKVVDERHYDLRTLRAQGVKLGNETEVEV